MKQNLVVETEFPISSLTLNSGQHEFKKNDCMGNRIEE